MKKYTNEQLSRILSEHSAGRMRRYGYALSMIGSSGFCVGQVANNQCDSIGLNPKIARWFDRSYCEGWSVDRFLRELEKQGLA
jgi:hypothetical protein